MRSLRVLVILAALTVFGVGIIHAADDGGVPTFSDGRVNTTPIDEPAAVFCIFDRSTDSAVFQRIEVWGLSADKLLEASAAQIDAAAAGTVLDTNWSYTLTKLADDSFNVTAPTGYSFTWKRGDFNC